jgi:DNA (cytosine-5)-methyltransferase 1
MANPYLLRKPSRAGAQFSAVDLFSGAGGISLGLTNAGFDVLFCSDRDSACAATHRYNFPSIPFAEVPIEHLDARQIMSTTGLRKGELDLLIGGPPCQGFSIIGQRQIWDPRNGLLHDFLRIAKELRPRCIVIENVTGLATLESGVLLAAQYGVPQMRWRMFFIGWRFDEHKRGGFPLPTHGRTGIGDLVPNRSIPAALTEGFVTIRDAIGDLPPVGPGERTDRYTRKPRGDFQEAMRSLAPVALANHYATRLSPQNLARIEALSPGEDWRALPRHLLPPSMQRALRKDHTRRFRRMKWDGIARSIITRFRDPKSGEYIHPEQHRTISIREAARIQSFPDWFAFSGNLGDQYNQVGNAVPPLLARAVARELKKMLASGRGTYQAPVKSRYLIPSELTFAAE